MRRLSTLLILALASLSFTGCDLVGDLLEFGFWAIIILIALLFLVIWAIRAAFRRGRDRRPPPPRT